MTPAERHEIVLSLNWQIDETAGRHQICGERCGWIVGMIDGVALSAWIGERSGIVYLHLAGKPGEYDFEFEAFCEIVKNGWPKAKAAPAARSLFGDAET